MGLRFVGGGFWVLWFSGLGWVVICRVRDFAVVGLMICCWWLFGFGVCGGGWVWF